MSIRETIMKARAAQRLTQDQMADAIGFSRVTVSNWETGKTEPSIDALQTLQHSDVAWIAALASDILDIMFPAREMARIGD